MFFPFILFFFLTSWNLFFTKHLYTTSYEVLIGDNMAKDITTIKLQRNTRTALASIGSKGDSYDDIIRMLLLEHDESITFD